jgi:hypothetical protein
MRFRSFIAFSLLMLALLAAPGAWAATHRPAQRPAQLDCKANLGYCTEPFDSGYDGQYVGHDEPALLFYSNVPGSGNSSIYQLTLPKDPPTLPRQDGTGGVFNFELHATIWMGMILCDSQSSPEFTTSCVPDSDANIFDNANPAAPDYIGHHPGAAYLEIQFYPPGWVGSPCLDLTHWCAGALITSNSVDSNTGDQNNDDCANLLGSQPGNFAFITKNGIPIAPANPLAVPFGTFHNDPNNILKFNSGDRVTVNIHDSPHGAQVQVHDVTTGQSGSMTTSAALSFGQAVFDPNGSTCQINPYDFHPMYSTSGEHTRATWAAHSFNVAFSDEIGHFKFCAHVAADGSCLDANADPDDNMCLPTPAPPLVQVSGCIGADFDFDGPSYRTAWPGATSSNDKKIHPTPVQFTSPQFVASSFPFTGLQLNYSRIAFEADLPNVERTAANAPPCSPMTGANCVNPPPGATFYPLYTTALSSEGCVWQFGGAHLPNTLQTFGGTSTAEYGPLYPLIFLRSGTVVTVTPDFHQTVNYNPCPSFPVF